MQAQASSIQTLQPLTGAAPSIVTLGDDAAIDPSIVAAVSETGPSPSIVTVPDTAATPSIVDARRTGAADEDVASRAAGGALDGADGDPRRRGRIGICPSLGSPAPGGRPAGAPLLDPNDKGTPSKRKALKRQAERPGARGRRRRQEPAAGSVDAAGAARAITRRFTQRSSRNPRPDRSPRGCGRAAPARLARTAASSSFTRTRSKNESTGSRNALSASMAAEKSSF